MPFYTLQPGQQCGHNGRDLQLGEVIELPVHVGRDLTGKLMPCTDEGVSLLGLSEDELVIAQAADHEKESLRAMVKPAVEAMVVVAVSVVPAMASPGVRVLEAPVAPENEEE